MKTFDAAYISEYPYDFVCRECMLKYKGHFPRNKAVNISFKICSICGYTKACTSIKEIDWHRLLHKDEEIHENAFGSD